MKSQNKHSFEEEWRNAFNDAEEATDDALWTRLDSHLANQEAIKYKNKYRYISIAATLALLLISLSVTVWWFNHSNQHKESLSENVSDTTQPDKEQALATKPNSGTSLSGSATIQESIQDQLATGDPGSHEQSIASSATSQETIVSKAPGEETASLPKSTAQHPARRKPAAVSVPPVATAADAPALATAEHNAAQPSQAMHGQDESIGSTSENLPYKPAKSLNTAAVARSGANHQNTGKATSTLTENTADVQQNTAERKTDSKSGVPGNKLSSYQAAASNSIGHRDTSLQSRPFKQLPVQLPLISPPDESLLPQLSINHPKEPAKALVHKAWWIGAAFTPLYFNPNFKANYQQAEHAMAPNPTHAGIGSFNFEDMVKPDFSYLLSLEAGKKLGRRWQVKSGLQYLHYNSILQTRAFFEPDGTTEKVPLVTRMLNEPTPQRAYMDVGFNNGLKLNTSESTVTLRNQYQYISIPLQAGFVLNPADPISFALTTGLAADFFIMNTMKGEEENIRSASISGNDNTIYRTVTLTGLLGVDVSYVISKRYAISFQPLCRAALHSSTTKNASIRSKPFTAGAGLGLKYSF